MTNPINNRSGEIMPSSWVSYPGDICQDATGPGALNMTFTVATSTRLGDDDRFLGGPR
jgi:hypothetical protein